MLRPLVFAAALTSSAAFASILPPNSLYKEDSLSLNSGLEEAQFNATISFVESVYAPIVRGFGANLVINREWTNPEVNAYADRVGDTWRVTMYGGLARREELTEDGLALAICHEIGHHVGGYPFYSWGTDEGGADYFASGTCARTLWKGQLGENARHRDNIHPTAKAACDRRWGSVADQNLCYRISNAGNSLADLFTYINKDTSSFDRKDSRVVESTNHSHPASQCRLDTYAAGAICNKTVDPKVIPGRGLGNVPDAEKATLPHSCSQYEYYAEAFRPNCWFKPLLKAPTALSQFHSGCAQPNAQSNECHAAIHRYVNSRGLGNAGVAQEVGNNAYGVAAINAGFKGDASIATLRGYHSGCTFGNAQSNECVAATQLFCNAKGYGAGLTQEIGNQVHGVACFHSGWYGDIALSELKTLHAGCAFPAARSNECVAAIHRACNNRGYGAGIAQQIGNQVYGVACFNPAWYGNVAVNP